MSILGEKVEHEIDELAKVYPKREAILLPVLHAVQETHGFISEEAIKEVAQQVDVPLARVYEVVSFYSLFFDKPVGRHILTVCTNMTCGLMGGEGLCQFLSNKLGIKPGETTADGKFTLIKTNECLADCNNPPMMQINERYHSSLNRGKVEKLLETLK